MAKNKTASKFLSAKSDFHLLKSSSRENYKTSKDLFFADAKTLKWTFFQATMLAPIAAGKVHVLLHDSEWNVRGYFATHQSMDFSVSLCDFLCKGKIKEMFYRKLSVVGNPTE